MFHPLAIPFLPGPVGATVLLLALVASSGLALGSLKFKGFSLGIPGVMFTGLIAGHLVGAANLNEPVLAFVRDFGLILFVYAVGIQVGPGFLASLRTRGLPWNLMAAAVVLLGALLSVALAYLTHTDIRAAVGLFAGGTTNAPALGSAQEALKSLYGPEQALSLSTSLVSPAFAIAYPFGLLGVILAMLALRSIFRADPAAEAVALDQAEKSERADVSTLNIELKNPNLDGLALARIAQLAPGENVVVSRIMHRGSLMIAKPDTPVSLGDVLLAVGPREQLADFRLIVGNESPVDLRTIPSSITTRQFVVTRREALAKTVDELDLPRRLGVTITRVSRTEIEFAAVGNLRLQFGDRVRAVGESSALDAAAQELGNSLRELNLPRLLPIFIGLLLGVAVGSLATTFGGALPGPVKLGLAAGPMIVAIILARIGRLGPLLWYMPHSASALLRELGIVLFLVSVGLLAGDGFFAALRTPTGLYWLLLGSLVTFLPLLLVGLAARIFFRANYLHICGLLAGSMTSPSLAFTTTMTPSEAPAVAFATVYPLTMILRVLLAQLLILIFH